MKSFLFFVAGLFLGASLHWYLGSPRERGVVVEARSTDTQSSTNTNTNTITVETRRETFDRERIKEELAQTGRVIREKARHAGQAVSDATADARITGTIKAKLLKESNLAALKIDVDTHDGAVTLSGVVSSPDDVSRAMELAYETEGVNKVVSTLQVKGQ